MINPGGRMHNKILCKLPIFPLAFILTTPAPFYRHPAYAENLPCRLPSHITMPLPNRAAASAALIGIRMLAGGGIISSASAGKYIKTEIKTSVSISRPHPLNPSGKKRPCCLPSVPSVVYFANSSNRLNLRLSAFICG